MKRYATFVHLINWLAVLAAAIWLTYHGATRWLEGGEPNALAVAQTVGGLILLLLNLLLAILRILSTRTVTYLIFEKEGAGSLKVSVDAIEEVLTKCALAVPEITRATVKLQLEKGGNHSCGHFGRICLTSAIFDPIEDRIHLLDLAPGYGV